MGQELRGESRMGNKTKSLLKLRANRTSFDLGALAAERDTHLSRYYVGRDRFVARALNVNDTASFFVAPKGVGKSAILEMVRQELKRTSSPQSPNPGTVITLSPSQLAISAFSNINITSPLLNDPNKKQWLYKSLWDYIFSTEIGAREYVEDNAFIGFIMNFVRSRDERSIKKLMRLRLDEKGNPEPISARFLKLIKEVEVSAKHEAVGQIAAKATLDHSQSGQNPFGQYELLGLIHHVATRIADTIKNRYYFLIDDLDNDWHNEPLQNELIAAMFSSLQKMCRPPHLKCIVAIQDRIFTELPIEHKDKFRDFICRVDWEVELVQEMIDRRIKHIIDIPPAKIWAGDGLFPKDSFELIMQYTSGKPREAIRLVSLCLETAKRGGRRRVEPGDITYAAKVFSKERAEDIATELEYVYPSFHNLLRHFSGFQKEVRITRIQDAVDKCILAELDKEKSAMSWIRGFENDPLQVAKILLENGILLFKHNQKDAAQPYNSQEHDVYSDKAFVAFHPMFAPGLGIIGA